MVGVRVIVGEEKYTSVGGVMVADLIWVGVRVHSKVGVDFPSLLSLVMITIKPRQ